MYFELLASNFESEPLILGSNVRVRVVVIEYSHRSDGQGYQNTRTSYAEGSVEAVLVYGLC